MKASPSSIIIVSKDLMLRDGVGNSARSFRDYFQSLGFDVKMVAKNSDDSSVLRLDEYLTTHDINSVLIYHFSIFDPYFSCFLELKWKKKILYYHGITPPEFLKSPLADECRSGLAQISQLPCFDLYLSNSFSSMHQFLSNTLSKPIFEICPPILSHAKSPFCLPNISRLDLLSHKPELIFLINSSTSTHKCIERVHQFLNNLSHSFAITLNFVSRSTFPNTEDESLYNRTDFIDVDDKKMAEVYRSSHIYISFSSHEGYSIPFFLSLYYGLVPIIQSSAVANEYLPDSFPYLSNHPSTQEFKSVVFSLTQQYTEHCRYSHEMNLSFVNSSMNKLLSLLTD